MDDAGGNNRSALIDGVVLVHGGVHGAWCWERVMPLIAVPVIAVDLPGRGVRPFEGRQVHFRDCVEAVLDEADAAGFERFVLVGHSMGGLTVTSTALAAPQRVARGVYLAALAPPPGVSVNELFQVPVPDDFDPCGRMPVPDLESATAMFGADLDPAAAAAAHARCVPEPNGLFIDTIPRYDHGVPTTYIQCRRDAVVPQGLVDLFVGVLQPDEVRVIDTDHDSMLSHPVETAAEINRLVV